jgi:hypothetical protein
MNFQQYPYRHILDYFGAVITLFVLLTKVFYVTKYFTHLENDFMKTDDLKASIETSLFVLILVSDNFSEITIMNENSELIVFGS